jgi:hypothetical protein
MAEKPILFNAEMVQAILAGLKTQTRRIIKGFPLYPPFFEVDEGRGWLEESESGTFYALEAFSKVQPGDVLWVRETWQRLFDHKGWRYKYRADYNDDEPLKLGGMYVAWRPSIHMPREAARIFLKVKDVRAERLKSITIDEIKAEGLTSAAVHVGDEEIAFKEWELLWNCTIKKADLPRYGWDANPWVWVIEFERINPQNL